MNIGRSNGLRLAIERANGECFVTLDESCNGTPIFKRQRRETECRIHFGRRIHNDAGTLRTLPKIVVEENARPPTLIIVRA